MRSDGRDRILTGAAVVDAAVDRVYAALLHPSEQLRWNSLYLEASLVGPGPITTGSVMTGRFKGSGRSVVTFEAVRRNEHFTHRSAMHLGPVPLGSLRHTFQVRAVPAGTEVTQLVRFGPTGIGHLVAPLVLRAFRSRLPDSFHELDAYLSAAGTGCAADGGAPEPLGG